MYVKPSPGLKIPDPDLQDHLPEEGREVTESYYWHRRIADKDVTVSAPPSSAAAAAPPAAVATPAPATVAAATDKPAVADRSAKE